MPCRSLQQSLACQTGAPLRTTAAGILGPARETACTLGSRSGTLLSPRAWLGSPAKRDTPQPQRLACWVPERDTACTLGSRVALPLALLPATLQPRLFGEAAQRSVQGLTLGAEVEAEPLLELQLVPPTQAGPWLLGSVYSTVAQLESKACTFNRSTHAGAACTCLPQRRSWTGARTLTLAVLSSSCRSATRKLLTPMWRVSPAFCTASICGTITKCELTMINTY